MNTRPALFRRPFLRRIPHGPERILGKPRGLEAYPLPHRLRFTLKELIGLKPTGELLDAAAGDGRLAAEIASRFPSITVTAVDLSPAWKETALTQFSSKGVSDRCRYLLTDLEKPWSLPENTFDGVVCAFALHHFRHPESSLENLFRSIRPGGWLFLADFKRVSWLYVLPLWNRFMESIRAAYTSDELLSLFARSALPSPILRAPFGSWYLGALTYKPRFVFKGTT